MRQKHEAAQYGELPTTLQLDRLNGQLLLFANRHHKLRITTRQEGIKRYWMSRMSRYECPGVLDGSPFGYLVEESMGAVATLLQETETWNLRIYDRFDTTEFASQRGGSRTMYAFEWNHDGVETAIRKTIVTPDRRKEELADIIDTFYVADDAAWVPDMQLRTEYIGPDDIDYLSNHLAQRMERVDAGQHAYSESRRNYLDYFAK